ncbi:hypothetical protein DT73_19295 [Mangrovibacter sp. MFB070]|uniref:YdbH family protein n=1 Tax=Mangrovibacter sp. MFB070 TaxID=1224318 RepID=UPI0004D64FDE|nr:YdbH family protein [Mangrovibacter sp. MFB070]KEA50962.1 hypothetical protein DT73_19295 [Mangrovibacter sp. MFB070]
MKGSYKIIITLALLVALLPFVLFASVQVWLPALARLWLPTGMQLVLTAEPKITLRQLTLPGLQLKVGDCTLVDVSQLQLSHPQYWRLSANSLTADPQCAAGLPAQPGSEPPQTLTRIQQLLPRGDLWIKHVNVVPWQQYGGQVHLSVSSERQLLSWQGDKLKLHARLAGQLLTISDMAVVVPGQDKPVTLQGAVSLNLVPDGLPEQGELYAHFVVPDLPEPVLAEFHWQGNQGEIRASVPGKQPLLVLPWKVSPQQISIEHGQWQWSEYNRKAKGQIYLTIDNWSGGPELAVVSGRLNALTEGDAGKGNLVMTLGPGKLSLVDSALPARLTGEIKQGNMIFYVGLPVMLSGPLQSSVLHFLPGALLRSRGRLVDSLDIDDVRLPLAGVQLTRNGVAGRLQAILKAHENQLGAFVIHLDGVANDFLPDNGRWRWRYWGNGVFDPMQARWDVQGEGEWHDSLITLNTLSTGFDQLRYGSMTVSKPRLTLSEPLSWQRNPQLPAFAGKLALETGKTTFSNGSYLDPASFTFQLMGQNPDAFNLRGELVAGKLGSVTVYSRWDGTRLRGKAWWPVQGLSHFQSLIPPDMKLHLTDGGLAAQVAFSAAVSQGFEAGGHGVIRKGAAQLPDNEISDVNFTLPFRFSQGVWHLGTRGPVRLQVGKVSSQFTATHLNADLQGWVPWDDSHPLQLSNVSVEVLGGKIEMRQLRLPQHDAALLRLNNLSSSELLTAVHAKQLAVSGRISGGLPLWLNNPQWIVKDGWLTNPGPLTFRLDKDMADAIVRDNVTAGSAINWLRYMEINHSWSNINVDNLGVLRLSTQVQGTSYSEGKSAKVNLNYHHEENIFTLWRSLRFADNLESWLEQNAQLTEQRCTGSHQCKEKQ